ncbi:MAG: hypothetical protein H8E71_05475 [Candidatus Marinimicrobia bacterium]|nr:hypothetical protein [Candidatus Neomarinimicrobiota bacterium]MBL7109622.1 hypothetical protein [Candidatus Neomarinimicrobiota bacterium]
MNSLKRLFLLFVLTSISIGTICFSQDITSFPDKPQSSSYIIPEDPSLHLPVNIWGHVKKPGQFLIPYTSNVDLVSLLSLAGGPLPGAKLNKILLVRERYQDDNSQIVYEIDLREFLETGDRTTVPLIEPNDTILIEQSFWSSMKQNSSFIQTLLYISTTALQIHQMTKN